TALSFSIVTSQIGALATWLILGPPPWQWRFPVVALMALPLGFLFLSRGHAMTWSVILLFQSVGLLGALIGLRLARFRLTGRERRQSRATTIAKHQFSMTQMFFWSSVVGIGIVTMKAMDIQPDWLRYPIDWFGHACLAVILSIVALAAI
ncbi:MAG: hypothetical protein N2C12_17410, partial [Planctomycetales bacterium]